VQVRMKIDGFVEVAVVSTGVLFASIRHERDCGARTAQLVLLNHAPSIVAQGAAFQQGAYHPRS
jgi:hypothetical protein